MNGRWRFNAVSEIQALHITRDRFHLAWDPAIPPIETVPSGAVVEFDLLDASGGQLAEGSTIADLATLDFARVDQVNGPIAVDDAAPGDVLQVDLLEFEPASWGWTANIPGFGLLADEFPDAAYRVTRVPGVDGGAGPARRAEFLPGIRVPVVPFCGELGVAPESGPRSTIPPDLHGGNMDTRHLTAGATLFLPVFQPGGRFSIGDGHAAQGDGEVCGTAIEAPMRAVVRLTARPDLHLHAPEFLTAPGTEADRPVGRRYATDGIGPDLLGAARDAVRRMIDWLGREHGVTALDAYLLCSVGIDLRISEIVDMPNYVVTAYCPLSIFD
jgi:acetamidase/formamidase